MSTTGHTEISQSRGSDGMPIEPYPLRLNQPFECELGVTVSGNVTASNITGVSLNAILFQEHPIVESISTFKMLYIHEVKYWGAQNSAISMAPQVLDLQSHGTLSDRCIEQLYDSGTSTERPRIHYKWPNHMVEQNPIITGVNDNNVLFNFVQLFPSGTANQGIGSLYIRISAKNFNFAVTPTILLDAADLIHESAVDQQKSSKRRLDTMLKEERIAKMRAIQLPTLDSQ